MKPIFSTLLALMLAACSTNPELGEKTDIPGKSIASISPALTQDAMANLKSWVKSEYGCSMVTVNNTEHVKTQGKILMDKRGRLFSGVVTENWIIEYCDKTSKIGMVFQPDGNGGSYIAINEILK